MSKYAHLEELAEEYRAASDRLRAAVRLAHAADAPVADIAKATNFSRQTVYRWINAAATQINVRTSLNDYLHLLATLVTPYTAEQLTRRIGNNDIHVLVNAVKLGLRNLNEVEYYDMDEETKQEFLLGNFVYGEAARVKELTGKYPNMVTRV